MPPTTLGHPFGWLHLPRAGLCSLCPPHRSPPWPHAPTYLTPPWAYFPGSPLLDPYTLLGGSHCSCYYPSWGGTREAQELFMSYTAIRARAEARILDSLFLKWQSFPNISGFQTFFQSSFLPTIYSVMQLFADLLNPMKSHTGPIKH